jgi:hypothetical protein
MDRPEIHAFLAHWLTVFNPRPYQVLGIHDHTAASL